MNWTWASLTDEEATNHDLDMAAALADLAHEAEAAVVTAVGRDADGYIISTAVYTLLDNGTSTLTIVGDNGEGGERTVVLTGIRTTCTE